MRVVREGSDQRTSQPNRSPGLLMTIFTGIIVVAAGLYLEYRTDLFRDHNTPTPSGEAQTGSTDVPGDGSADQAVRDYFALVLAHKTEEAFSMLTERFRSEKLHCAGLAWHDCLNYCAWVDSMTNITINDLSVQETTPTTAALIGDITFYPDSERDQYTNYRIDLVWDSFDGNWLIDRTNAQR